MTWIITLAVIGALVLLFIGLGPTVFFGGVFTGITKIIQNPSVSPLVNQTEDYMTQQLNSTIQSQFSSIMHKPLPMSSMSH